MKREIRSILTTTLIAMLGACGGGGGSDGGTAIPVTMTLTAQVTSPYDVALSWSPHSGGVTGYDVYRNGRAAFPTHVSGTAVTDRNLRSATQYCYVVYAVSFPLGTVGQSNTVCVTTNPTSVWNSSVVGNGSFVSLALDSANVHHVSYRNANGVQVAADTTGSWSVENVDAGAGTFGHTAIAIGATGTVHTSYYDAQAGMLHYATNGTGAWVNAVVDAAGGGGNALVLDGAGHAHVSYAGNPLSSLNYATNASGSWVSSFVSGFSNGPVQRTSLGVDSNGAVHIGYAAGSGICAIGYTDNTTGSWTDTLIDDNAQCGIALAVDANNASHIAYMKSMALHYATNRSGSWVSTIVDTLSWLGGAEVSIAIDGSGRAHISYQGASSDLRYATNSSGMWQVTYIAGNGAVGEYSQIRVDPAGRIHIVYTDATTGAVRLATSP